MRTCLLGFLLAISSAAHADLYRWLDPDTGSVRISSLPPSDPRVQAEIVRTPAARKPGAAASASLPELEARWRSLLMQLAVTTPEDFSKGGDGLRRQLEAYEAARAELDRRDPGGAARRRAESAPVMERLKQGAAAQLGRTPPAQR